MRACKLGLVDSSNSVARLVLEPHSRTVVAAVISDSSCILASLDHTVFAKNREKHKQFRIKVPTIRDLCFIRLEVRDTPTTPTSGSSGSTGASTRTSSTRPSTSGYGSTDHRFRKGGGQELLQFGQFGPKASPLKEQQQQQPQQQVQLQADDSELAAIHNVLLVASPGLGGSCTDFRAWGCDDSSFKQIHVEAAVQGTRRNGKTGVFARFEIPAAGVKIAASVNIMAVLAPSVSKVWVFAVKSQIKEGKQSLLILNCSVLEVSEAVSAIHMSTHYLFLSGTGGVRLLPLRPLVKGREMSKVVSYEKLRSKVQGSLNGVHENGLKKRNGHIVSQEDTASVEEECNGYCIDRQCMKASEQNGEKKKNGLITQCKVELFKKQDIEQLVTIYPLTPMQFLMLDAAGTLHVLVLKTPTTPRRKTFEVEMKVIKLPFAVASFTVFPDAFDAAGSSHSGDFPKFWNLWVTDGKNSIYAIAIYDATFIAEDNIFPIVMQAVFMGSRTDSVFAVSKDTVLALSEGALVTYVNAGG